ncbi:MAG: hypothetical protein Q7R48_02850 [bacterium]|nr:hypothetical protein [bacterium]
MKDEKQELFEQISKKLSVLIALSFVENLADKTAEDSIKILGRFGLNNQDIADMLGVKKTTIEVLKSRIKKTSQK